MKHGTHSKNRKASVTKANLIYTVGVPVVFFGIIILIGMFIKSQITGFYNNHIKPVFNPKSTTVENIKKNDDGTRSIEDIINSSIDDVLAKEDLTLKPNYANMTLDEILNKNTSKTTDDYLAEELAIKYVTGTYQGITKDGAIVLDMNGENKYIYLIGISNPNSSFLGAFLDDYETLYVEYDISKKHGSGEQAYVWISEPNNDEKDNMVNVIAIVNGWGTYVDPSPNIKYTYYFLKVKP